MIAPGCSARSSTTFGPSAAHPMAATGPTNSSSIPSSTIISAEPYLFVIEITVITKYPADAEADPGEFCRAGQTAGADFPGMLKIDCRVNLIVCHDLSPPG